MRRFSIVYAINRPHRIIRIVAVDHRREIYEQAAEQIRRTKRPGYSDKVVDVLCMALGGQVKTGQRIEPETTFFYLFPS